jgi:hypothetical protein
MEVDVTEWFERLNVNQAEVMLVCCCVLPVAIVTHGWGIQIDGVIEKVVEMYKIARAKGDIPNPALLEKLHLTLVPTLAPS